MSRVLLFVQSRDGRPRCVKQFGANEAAGRQYLAKIPFGGPGQPMVGWLVECENAKAGRTIIRAARPNPFGPEDYERARVLKPRAQGRILASGGKR